MPHAHPSGPQSVRVVTVTISDTRTEADDESGRVLREALTTAGHVVIRHAIIPDEPERVRAEIEHAVDVDHVDAIVTTGGTGISPRDQTYEAVHAMLEKTLDGFGEAFRRLSFDEIGPRAMLSRAVAGTFRGAMVFALPGSKNAVRLGATQLVAPILGHAVAILRGKS